MGTEFDTKGTTANIPPPASSVTPDAVVEPIKPLQSMTAPSMADQLLSPSDAALSIATPASVRAKWERTITYADTGTTFTTVVGSQA